MTTYHLERDIPVDEGYDLVVAGGGPAGSAAAVAAGRLGIKVLLIEALGNLGGKVANSALTAAAEKEKDAQVKAAIVKALTALK